MIKTTQPACSIPSSDNEQHKELKKKHLNMSLTDAVCHTFDGRTIQFKSETESNLQHANDHISDVSDQLKADESSEGMDPEHTTVGDMFGIQSKKSRLGSGYPECSNKQDGERFDMMKHEIKDHSIVDFNENAARRDHIDDGLREFTEQNNNLRDHIDYIFRDMYDEDDDDLSTFSDENNMTDDASFSTPVGLKEDAECEICYEMQLLFHRHCCSKPYCESCLNTYCQFLVDSGKIKFPCPNPDCNKLMYQSEVYSHLEMEFKSKLYRNLLNANTEPLKKTCPRCSEVLSLSSDVKLTTPKSTKYGLNVTCARCQLDWCFHCHAPWHRNMTCRQYRKGDKLVLEWAKQITAGQMNARRCPKCKILIQRKSGCDHMLCSRCGVNFCYRCGCKFRRARFLGDHYSKFGIFGCRYLLFEKKPFLRKLIRGSIFGGKVIVAPVLGVLVLVGGVVLFAGAVVASPVIAGLAIRRNRKRRRMKADIAEMLAHDEQRIAKIRDQDDPYWGRYSHLREIGANNLWQLYTATQGQSHEPREIIRL